METVTALDIIAGPVPIGYAHAAHLDIMRPDLTQPDAWPAPAYVSVVIFTERCTCPADHIAIYAMPVTPKGTQP